jgi:hypothetical protein
VFLFGAKTRFKQAPDGKVVERGCDECGTTRTFVECDVTDELQIFFTSVAKGTQRRLVCTECGEDIEVEAPSAPRASAPSRPAPLKKDLSEAEKDAMLAALKHKMSPK